MRAQGIWKRFRGLFDHPHAAAGVRRPAGGAIAPWDGLEPLEARLLLDLASPHVEIFQQVDGEIKLGWEAVPDATSYRVYRCEDGGHFELHEFGIADAPTENDPFVDALREGVSTYYQVTAIDGDEESGVWETVAALAPPTGLTATVVDKVHDPEDPDDVHTVSLSWDAAAPRDDLSLTYTVTRRDPVGNVTELVTGLGAFSYEDEPPDADTPYVYTITLRHTGEEGTITEASPSIGAPAVLATVEQNRVRLSWVDMDEAERFDVYRRLDNPHYSLFERDVQASVENNVATYDDFWSDFGEEYTYKLVAVDVDGGEETGHGSGVVEDVDTVPAPADDLTASPDHDAKTISLAWGEVSGAHHYELCRSANGDAAVLIKVTEQTSYVDHGHILDEEHDLEYGVKYVYTVTGVTEDGDEGIPSRAVPATLRDLQVPENGKVLFVPMSSPPPCDYAAHVYWDRVSGATHYHIYRDNAVVGTVADAAFDGRHAEFKELLTDRNGEPEDVYVILASRSANAPQDPPGVDDPAETAEKVTCHGTCDAGVLLTGDKYILSDDPEPGADGHVALTVKALTEWDIELTYTQGVLSIYDDIVGGQLLASGTTYEKEMFSWSTVPETYTGGGHSRNVAYHVTTLYIQATGGGGAQTITLSMGENAGSLHYYDTIPVSVFDLDFTPDGTVVLQINDGDGDGDGVLDYCDGFNADRLAYASDDDPYHSRDDLADNGATAAAFATLGLGLSGDLDTEHATVRFRYGQWDPVDAMPAPPNRAGEPFLYPGRNTNEVLRLWSSNDGARTIETCLTASLDDGCYIPANDPCSMGDLDFSANQTSTSLYAEGFGSGVHLVTVVVDPDGAGPGRAHAREVQIAVGSPRHVAVNLDDDDNDGIPDFADGFDRGANDLDDQTAGGDDFLALSFAVPSGYEYLRLSYSASAPSGTTRAGSGTFGDPYAYTLPAEGCLRLWTLPEDFARDKDNLPDGDLNGNYLPPICGEDEYDLFWFDPDLEDVPRVLHFYVEAVAVSSTGTEDITVTFGKMVGDDEVFDVSHTVHVIPLAPDLAIDSDNDNGTGAPDGSAAEDQIENNDPTTAIDAAQGLVRAGKSVPLNLLDVDDDGVPDFADGYNLDGLPDMENGQETGSTDDDFTRPVDAHELFVPVVIELPKGIDLATARIKLIYWGSDPAGVTTEDLPGYDSRQYLLAGQDDDGEFAEDAGFLRLWTRREEGGSPAADDNLRSARPFFDPGDITGRGFYVPPTLGIDGRADYDTDGLRQYYGPEELAELGFADTDTGRTITLYLEGVRASEGVADQQIILAVDPDGAGPDGYLAVDGVRVTVGTGDLDIDSDNTSDAEPERDALEELIEADDDRPGKIILVNTGDKDGDGILDFADGFNADPADPNDDTTEGEYMVPLLFELPAWVDLNEATFRFTYDASDPADLDGLGGGASLAFVPATGKLRLWTDWTKTGDPDQRSPDPVDEDDPGDYVPDDFDCTPAQLGWGGDATTREGRTVTLYVEAIRPSDATGDLTITVQLDADGDGEDAHYVDLDTVHLTALDATNANAHSGAVRLTDGTVALSATDLVSGGFSGPWGQGRTFTDRTGFAADALNGNGMASHLPSLVQASNAIIVQAGGEARYFDYNGLFYLPRFDTKASLEFDFDEVGDFYRLAEDNGSAWLFYTFDRDLPPLQRGQLLEYVDPAGNRTTTVYAADGRLLRVRRGVTDLTETFYYDYDRDEESPDAGRRRSVSLKRKEMYPQRTIVGEVQYAYYAEDDDHGDDGDMKTATVFYTAREKSGGEVVGGVDTTYYRYEAPGLNGCSRLKLVLGPDAYQLAVGDGKDPETAGDLEDYADFAFTYVSEGVSAQHVQGAGASQAEGDNAVGTFSYAYDSPTYHQGGPAIGPNAWVKETTVTDPGGEDTTVYTNYAGQAMLSVVTASGVEGEWCTFNVYDPAGRVVLQANPSAVSGYDDSGHDLLGLADDQGELRYVQLKNSEGLVRHYAYYLEDNPSSGGIAGYLEQASVSKGEKGDTIPQRTMTYLRGYDPAWQDPTRTMVLTKSETIYCESQIGEDQEALTTQYYYAGWLEAMPRGVLTVLPAVPDQGNTVMETLDDFGRRLSLLDADEKLQTWLYDPATGAVKKHVVDAEEENGAKLTTLTTRDKLGRPTKITEPTGHETEFAYVDSAEYSEVVTTPTIGPREIVVHHREAGLRLTATVAHDGEAVYALTVERSDLAGRAVATDEYYDLNDVDEQDLRDGTVPSEGFYRTSYKYDDAGRMYWVEEPTGKITQTVFDGLGRAIETNVGKGSPVTVSERVYDDGDVGDGNVTEETLYPGVGDTRVTTMAYDYRNRLIQTIAPDGVITTQTLDNFGRPLLTVTKTGTEPDTTTWAKTANSYDARGRLRTVTQYDAADPNNESKVLVTTYDYDASGRQTGTLGPDGIYHQTVYNDAGQVAGEYTRLGGPTGAGLLATEYVYVDGRLTETWAGKPGNVVLVSRNHYDHNGAEQYRLTATDSLIAAEDLAYASTYYDYDDAGRQDLTVAPDGTATEVTEFDALGRALATETWSGGGVLLAKSENLYEGDGPLLSASRIYYVDDGTAGAALTTTYHYDNFDRLDKVGNPDGTYQFTDYNRLGEVTSERVTESDGGGSVVEGTVYTRDSVGRPIMVEHAQRNAGGTTYRVRYEANWYDALGHVTANADYGVCVTAPNRPVDPPGFSADHIYTGYGYDGFGRRTHVVDNAGTVTRTVYDDAGRVIYTIDNFDEAFFDGDDYSCPDGNRSTDQARVTEYEYNDAGLLWRQTAVDPDADSTTDDNQVTQYSYGQAGAVPGNHHLWTVNYPENETVNYAYYSNGLRHTYQDQRGVVHTYTYDVMGRKTGDMITDGVGGDSDVDDAVWWIGWQYDDLGRVRYVTSYGDADGTNVLNQVEYRYDGWGNVKAIGQDNFGPVDPDTSPELAYAYEGATESGEAQYSRLGEVTYPGGNSIHYNYGTSPADLTRVANIAANGSPIDADIYAQYTYEGLATIVGLAYPAIPGGVVLDYTTAGARDAFDRIIKQEWVLAGASFLDQYEYAYDASSNRVSRANVLQQDFNETYTYDGLNRLTTFTRAGESTGESIAQSVKLSGLDSAPDDLFGLRTALFGNTAIIGAYGHDSQEGRSGAAYLIRDTGFGWQEIAMLTADDAQHLDLFGNSVGISGNVAVVAARWDDNDNGTDAGSVYVFREDQAGWEQVAKLTASDGADGECFGGYLAIEGDTLFIAAWYDEQAQGQTGSVYVFTFDEVQDEWTERQKIPAPEGAPGRFGYFIDVCGDTAVFSSYDAAGTASGAAYVYHYDGEDWDFQQKLQATGGLPDDRFGCSVAVWGDTLFVGASQHDNAGCVYVYENQGTGENPWVETAQLQAENPAAGEQFGWSTAIYADRAIIGAYQGDQKGAAYIFGYNGLSEQWTQLTKLSDPEGAYDDRFGFSVCINGDYAIAGAYRDDNPGNATGSASFYVSIQGGRLAQDWQLDGVGNWTATTVNGVTQTRQYNQANEITGLDGDDTNIAYDPAGNMSVIPQLPLPGYAPGRFLCTYDAWNRLTAVHLDDGETPGALDADDTPVAEYRYNGQGQRIAKLVRVSEPGHSLVWDRTDYFYNAAWQVMEERYTPSLPDGEKDTEASISADPAVQYVWDIRYVDSPVCRFRHTNTDGIPDEVLYYLTDANFNVTALVNESSGGVVERYIYSAYGQVQVVNGGEDFSGQPNWTLDADNVSDWLNELLYAGYRHDPETHLYSIRNRNYHPTLGRWLERDPEVYIDGMSMYQYCQSGPTGATDPMGRDTWSWVDPTGALRALGRAAAEAPEIRKRIMAAAPGAVGRLDKVANEAARSVVSKAISVGRRAVEAQLPSASWEETWSFRIGEAYGTSMGLGDMITDVVELPLALPEQVIDLVLTAGWINTGMNEFRDGAVHEAMHAGARMARAPGCPSTTPLSDLNEAYTKGITRWVDENVFDGAVNEENWEAGMALGSFKSKVTATVLLTGWSLGWFSSGKAAGASGLADDAVSAARSGAPTRGLSIAARRDMVAARTAEHVALRSRAAAALRQGRAGGLTQGLRDQLRTLGGQLGWAEEAQLVRMTGQGTRAWSAAEMRELLQTGRVGGYSPHHIWDVAGKPWLAAKANNIQMAERWIEHGLLHGGNTLNRTAGELINRSKLMIDWLMGR